MNELVTNELLQALKTIADFLCSNNLRIMQLTSVGTAHFLLSDLPDEWLVLTPIAQDMIRMERGWTDEIVRSVPV